MFQRIAGIPETPIEELEQDWVLTQSRSVVKMSVTAELIQKLKLKPKADETSEEFSKRAHQKVAALPDVGGWDDLSDEAQAWYNRYLIATEDSKKTKKTPMDIEKEILQYTTLKPEPDEKAEEFIARVITLELPVVKEEQHKAVEKTEDTEKETTVANSASKSNGKPEAKKAVAADKKPSGGVKGRPKLPDDAKISILSDKNPYREGSGSFKAFEKYKDGMTVAQAEKAGIPRAWILWDRREGHITTDDKAEAKAA